MQIIFFHIQFSVCWTTSKIIYREHKLGSQTTATRSVIENKHTEIINNDIENENIDR